MIRVMNRGGAESGLKTCILVLLLMIFAVPGIYAQDTITVIDSKNDYGGKTTERIYDRNGDVYQKEGRISRIHFADADDKTKKSIVYYHTNKYGIERIEYYYDAEGKIRKGIEYYKDNSGENRCMEVYKDKNGIIQKVIYCLNDKAIEKYKFYKRISYYENQKLIKTEIFFYGDEKRLADRTVIFHDKNEKKQYAEFYLGDRFLYRR